LIIACVAITVVLTLPFRAIAAIEVTDDSGRAVRLDRPAQRIVALSPSLAESVFAIGAGATVVGVSSNTDHPVAAARLPVVASPGRIDLERLLALAPDLVLAWRSGNPARDLERLDRTGAPVFVSEPRRLADIPYLLHRLGALTGYVAQADDAAHAFATEVARAAGGGAEPVRTFVEVWHAPLLTVSGAHLISDILDTCGARNVFAALVPLTLRISREQLYVADPHLVIASGTPAQARASRDRWARMPLLAAVRDDRVAVVDPRLLHRQGPRLAEGVRAVCDAVRAARG